MRQFTRSFLMLALLGTTTLALLSYTGTIRREWNYLCQTWERVRERSTANQAGMAIEPAPVPDLPQRNRTVRMPARQAVQTAPELASSDDPFLVEARRRAADDPVAAMHWLQTEATSHNRLRGMLEVVALWAAKDSPAALLWLESNAQGLARVETLNTGMELWGQQDPVAAAAWIDGMVNDGSKVSAAKALVSSWAGQDPENASQWIGQLPLGRLRDEAARTLVDSWAKTEPEAAAIWALSEAEFNGNTDLLKLSIEQYTQTSPHEAEHFVRSMHEAYQAPAAIEAYVRSLARTDPIKAMDWQHALPAADPLRQTKHAEIIMQEWSHIDSVAASIWLHSAVPGTQRDAAIIGFTTTMLHFDPEAAVAWSNTISVPEQRIAQLNRAMQSWAYTHPDQALDWLQQTALEPDLRRALADQIAVESAKN